MWNAGYSRLAEQAVATRRNLWSPSYCGAGPSDASPLQVTVNSDADGTDGDDVNGEWVRIRNLDPVNDVHLGGWWVRDTALHRYVFPDYTTIAPNDSLKLYVGAGTSTWTEFFWRSRTAGLRQHHAPARSATARSCSTPQGDLRASMTYPCRLACADPNEGAIAIAARPTGTEYVTLRNSSGAAVDLQDYRLESPPWGYTFGLESVLQPGERMRIDVRRRPGTGPAAAAVLGPHRRDPRQRRRQGSPRHVPRRRDRLLRVRHRALLSRYSSSSTRRATANAELAAGTPQ